MSKVRVFLVILAVSFVIRTPDPLFTQTLPTLTATNLDALRFRTIGPANMSGRIVDLAVVASNPYTFYVASATGGLWKTTDNGTTFTPVFQHEAVPSLGCVTVS